MPRRRSKPSPPRRRSKPSPPRRRSKPSPPRRRSKPSPPRRRSKPSSPRRRKPRRLSRGLGKRKAPEEWWKGQTIEYIARTFKLNLLREVFNVLFENDIYDERTTYEEDEQFLNDVHKHQEQTGTRNIWHMYNLFENNVFKKTPGIADFEVDINSSEMDDFEYLVRDYEDPMEEEEVEALDNFVTEKFKEYVQSREFKQNHDEILIYIEDLLQPVPTLKELARQALPYGPYDERTSNAINAVDAESQYVGYDDDDLVQEILKYADWSPIQEYWSDPHRS